MAAWNGNWFLDSERFLNSELILKWRNRYLSWWIKAILFVFGGYTLEDDVFVLSYDTIDKNICLGIMDHSFKTNLLVGVSAIAIVLISIQLAPRSNEGRSLTSSISYIGGKALQVLDTTISSVPFARIIFRRHHRKRHTIICEDKIPPNLHMLDGDCCQVVIVDQDGCGNYTTVQTAVDAVPDHSSNRTCIVINAGVYFLVLWLQRA